jgi:hypothetical protein
MRPGPRLAPFFHLPGLVVPGQNSVRVELRPFNDRQYNRELAMLCERVNNAAPHLPDGRRLLFQGVSLFDVCTSRMRRNLVASIAAKMSMKLLPDCHYLASFTRR